MDSQKKNDSTFIKFWGSNPILLNLFYLTIHGVVKFKLALKVYYDLRWNWEKVCRECQIDYLNIDVNIRARKVQMYFANWGATSITSLRNAILFCKEIPIQAYIYIHICKCRSFIPRVI